MKVDSFGKLVRVEKTDLDENGGFVCNSQILRLGANSFCNVKYELRSVSMKNVEKIDQFAFLDCSELEFVNFSQNLCCVDYGAFMGCCRIKNLAFPKSLKYLGHWAFLDCTSLEKVEFFCDLVRIDKTCQSQACDFLANEVFDRCRNIKKFVFHKNFDYNHQIKKFEKLKEIQIDDEIVAEKFWRDAIFESPQSFMLLDSRLFFNQSFVKKCLICVEFSFEKQFGSNEKLAKELSKTLFEQKLLLEESRCFDDCSKKRKS